ncbi:MAG: Gfo/Idh/MocA family oxidoreductase [Gemmatimonadetes bacterium]|nr:Gfo/Idh/MocA family oxidoreductase [Gemmatimonadota bacterium]
MSKRIPRRDFVRGASSAAAFTIVPRHVLGRGSRAPSDAVNVACIGVGGMGRNDVRGLAQAGASIVALCDVDDEAAADSYRAYPQARKYKDWREMLERERGIDAVTVSTPDHTHAAATLAVLRAGKHCRTQKPLTRTIAEARAIRDAAAQRPRLVTQMGNQGHANEGVRQIREWVEAGLIGAVREVHYWTNRPIWPQGLLRPTEAHNPRPTLDWNLWLGPAPERPYTPAYAPFRWRGWWDFGTGALGDMACHLMDAAYWVLDLGYPSRIEAECSQLFTETAPKSSRIIFTFPAKGSRPSVTVVWRDGALVPPRPAEWPATDLWPFAEDGGQLWIGDQGKLVAGVYAENPKLLDRDRMAEVTAHPLEQRYPRTPGVYAEFINAITNNQRAGSDFAGHATGLTEMVLLGCLAQRLGAGVELDPTTGRILTAGIPADWITPVYRRGWNL